MWFRNDAPVLKKLNLLPLFAVSKWCPSTKKYDLLPLVVALEWCPSAKKYVAQC